MHNKYDIFSLHNSFIKQRDGATLSIDCEPSTTIEQVAFLSNNDGIQSKLVFNGTVLLNDQTLNDYNIKQGDTINAINMAEFNPNCEHETPGNEEDELAILLRDNQLYDGLYQVLNKSAVDLDILRHTSLDEVNDFCKAFGLE